MYQEEMMQEPGLSEEFVASLPLMIESLTRRVEGLEGREQNPLEMWGEDEVRALRQRNEQLRCENAELKAGNDELRVWYADACREKQALQRRVGIMQAGYNAIATIQARLDANEREMEGNRCCTG